MPDYSIRRSCRTLRFFSTYRNLTSKRCVVRVGDCDQILKLVIFLTLVVMNRYAAVFTFQEVILPQIYISYTAIFSNTEYARNA